MSGTIFQIAAISGFVILFILSAFFSGSETALFSLSRARTRRLRDSGGRSGKTAADLMRTPRRLLTTIILGNIMVNVAISSISTYEVTQIFGVEAVAIAIPVITVLLLIAGEVTPKTFALMRPDVCARFAAYPLLVCMYVFAPLRWVMRHSTNVILAVLRQGHLQSDALLTREEFRATLQTGKTRGGIEPDEATIIHSISAYRTTVAREIMIPRPDIVCVDEQSTVLSAIKTARRVQHSQLPVYAENTDNIHSILRVKSLVGLQDIPAETLRICDLEEYCEEHQMNVAEGYGTLLHEAFAVPENIHIDALLYELSAQKENLAILLDEYGGTAGMVSRKMILDTLLGGLIDESISQTRIHVRPNGDVVASGRTRVAHINWECGFHIPDEGDDTIGGYVMRVSGSVPKVGDECTDGEYVFCVLQMSGNRIEAVRIHYAIEGVESK